MQEILSAHGYATHGIVSHDFVGAKWGFDQGFDSFQSFASGHRTLSSESVTEAALEKIDRLDEGATFLFVHYFDPHFFYVEHEAYRFSGPPPDAESEWWFGPWRKLRAQVNKGQISGEKRDYLVARYDSEIAFTDEHIGRLLDRLESKQHRKMTAAIQDGIKLVYDEQKDRVQFFENGGTLLAGLTEFGHRTKEGLARLELEEDVEITTEELEKLKALGYVD